MRHNCRVSPNTHNIVSLHNDRCHERVCGFGLFWWYKNADLTRCIGWNRHRTRSLCEEYANSNESISYPSVECMAAKAGCGCCPIGGGAGAATAQRVITFKVLASTTVVTVTHRSKVKKDAARTRYRRIDGQYRIVERSSGNRRDSTSQAWNKKTIEQNKNRVSTKANTSSARGTPSTAQVCHY